MSVSGSKQSRRERERECRRAREEKEKAASTERAQLVSGKDVPEGKSYMWDTTKNPKLAPGPVPTRIPPKARRYPVPEPGIKQSAFRELLRKRRASEVESGVHVAPPETLATTQLSREGSVSGGSLANGHASPSGNGNGLSSNAENGHAEPMDLDRTRSIEQELVELKSALATLHTSWEALEAKKAEQQQRRDQMKKELAAVRSRRTKRKTELEAKEKANSERQRAREEARVKAKQREEKRAQRRAEKDKVLEKHEEEKKVKEASLMEARQAMEKRQQRFSSLKAELTRMTYEKHSLVMQLKQVINMEDEARRRDENEARRREILQQAAVAASTAATPKPRVSSGGMTDEQLEEGECAPALAQEVNTPRGGLPGPPGSGLMSPRGFSSAPATAPRLPPHLAAAARSPSGGWNRVQQRGLPAATPAVGPPGFLPPHLNPSGPEPARAVPPSKSMSPVVPGGRAWAAPPSRVSGGGIPPIKSPRAGSGGFSWAPQPHGKPQDPGGSVPFPLAGPPSSANPDPNAPVQQRRSQH